MPTSIDFVRNSIKACKNIKRRDNTTSKVQFPCGMCLSNVNYGENSIHCTSCDNWFHLYCTNLTLHQFYDILENNNKNPDLIDTDEWLCLRCTFPFHDLTDKDLQNVNSADNMAFFNLMPEFSTSANVDQIHNLLNHDIDENLTDNINCKYYTHNEMCNLNESQKAFNIFHANVNGLESHFQDLHILLANIKCEFSAICISETSQKFNEKFKGNVSIHGFTEPFTTGSLSSKGG